MASAATIRVCVLEGQFTQLSNLGFPVSLAVELQQGGLCLDNAKWSSRLSDAGFSVSFFWPIARTTQHRRHRWRRKPRTNPSSGNFRTTTIVTNQERICPPIPSFSRKRHISISSTCSNWCPPVFGNHLSSSWCWSSVTFFQLQRSSYDCGLWQQCRFWRQWVLKSVWLPSLSRVLCPTLSEQQFPTNSSAPTQLPR